jgi:hypothetical protein
MSKPLSISTAADRSRALMTTLGVLAEIDAEHDLTGYRISVCPHEDGPSLSVWASPRTIATLFPAKSHAGPWYADGQQRNLTRTVRGVKVTAIQTRHDLSILRTTAAARLAS